MCGHEENDRSGCTGGFGAGSGRRRGQFQQGKVVRGSFTLVGSDGATFKAAKNVKYFGAVYGPDGQMVVCARLSSKGKAHPKKSHGRDDDKGRCQSDGDKGRGKSDDDKTRGKSDDAPGQAEDKTRGKSDDAPRGQGREKDKDMKPRD